MADYVTPRQLNETLDRALEKQTREITQVIRDLADVFSLQFLDVRSEIATIRQEIIDLRESHHHLIGTVDGLVGRIDHYETENAARDARAQRH